MTDQVLPLLQTEWGQDNEYAYYVTALGSWTNDNIGCTSKAFAQILFYHRLKPHNSPSPGYICSKDGQPDRSISLAFGNDYSFELFPRSFDPIHLSSDPTLAEFQKTQVQGYLFDVARAIGKNFYKGYLGNLDWLESHFDVYAKRYDYNKTKPEEMNAAKKLIETELSCYRPVLLIVDRTQGEGHAVVIDGFKKDGATFKVSVKWGNFGNVNNSNADNPDNPPWFDFEQTLGQKDYKYKLDGNMRILVTIRPKWHLHFFEYRLSLFFPFLPSLRRYLNDLTLE